MSTFGQDLIASMEEAAAHVRGEQTKAHTRTVEVPDVRAAVAEVTARGARVLDPEPKIGAHGNPVVFLHPKDCNGVLTELEEVTDDKRV